VNSLGDRAAKIDAWLVYTDKTSFQDLWFQTSAMESENRQQRGRNVSLDISTRIFASIRGWPGVAALEKELLEDGKVWCSAHLLEWAEKRAKHLGIEVPEFRKLPLEKALGVDRSIENAIIAAKAWCKDLGPNKPRISQVVFLEAVMKNPNGMIPEDIRSEMKAEWVDSEASCDDRARAINKKQLGFVVKSIQGAFRVMPPDYQS
jgi:hypothetical protein